MPSRKDLAVARLAEVSGWVGLAGWFLTMVPVFGPGIIAGSTLSALGLGVPAIGGVLVMDRTIALRLNRPNSWWTRFEQWRIPPPLCAVCETPLPRDWETSKEVMPVLDDDPDLGLMHAECPEAKTQ